MAVLIPENKVDLLVFQIARHACALETGAVGEVLLMPALVQSPARAALLDGFFNLRGTAVPLLPLGALFGLPAAEPELYTPIIVIGAGRRPVAIRVDRIDQVAEVSPVEIQRYAMDDSLNGCAEGQFRLEGRDVVVLSADRLLLREELAALEDLRARVEQRMDSVKDIR
jgi:chemotaxis signal transduction protein